MAHTCHAIDCEVGVPAEMFMCRRHWFSLPKNMRAAIWHYYRSGQCDDYNPSRSYCQQAVDCIRFIAEKEKRVLTGREQELTLYLQFHSPLNGVSNE